jgi:hypothetical protein
METWLDSLRENERLTTVLSYLIISLMIACFVLSVVQFADALFLGWEGSYLVVLGFLTALEACYTQRMRKHLTMLDTDWVVFYLGEVLVFILTLKVFQLLSHGSLGFWQQLTAMRQDFIAGFFNDEFFINLLVIFIVWVVSLSFARSIDVLRVSKSAVKLEEEVGISAERAQARSTLVNQFLLVGLAMVVMTSLLRFERTASWFQEPVTRLGVINIMLYFALGVVLLSLTQFTTLQMRWSVNHIPIHRQVAGRWALYSLLFLLLVILVTVLLPTQNTRGLLVFLGWIFWLLLMFYRFLVWVVASIVLLVAMLLSRLFGTSPPPTPASPPVFPTPMPPSEVSGQSGFPTILRDILVWGTLLILVVYLLVAYIQVRRQDVQSLGHVRWIAWLLALGQRFSLWWHGVRRQASRMISAGIERLRPPKAELPVSLWRYTSLRRMDSRQKILFYYQGMLRRAEQSGMPRQPYQTPYEYAEDMRQVLTASEQPLEADLEVMTEQFVEARYSRHEITLQQVGWVRKSWEHIKHYLRRLRIDRGSR